MNTRALLLALLSALLFGMATPASKVLLGTLTPFQLAGCLYLGAALAVSPFAWGRGRSALPADRRNRWRLLGAVLAGGVVGPVLMLLGLQAAQAASVSLWLNAEMAATAVLGVLVFREHLSRLGVAGVGAALLGSLLLSFTDKTAGAWAGALTVAACAFWGLDNHLTALIDGISASQSTFWKGTVAGATSLLIGLSLAPLTADWRTLLAAVFIGMWAYGASIVLYISAAQTLGATRAQIAFATAPFFGVVLAVVGLGEPLSGWHLVAGLLFLVALTLFTIENHAHRHTHAALDHAHGHRHDDGHHTHTHPGLPASTWHFHPHHHDPLTHAHPHWPDLHHRHAHEPRARG
jgi:drug/metabolite transporter (DMT)-like permease